MHKFKELENKLQALHPPDAHEQSHKLKARALQQAVAKLQTRLDEDNIHYDHKLNSMFDVLRKLEHTLKETSNELEIECTCSPRQKAQPTQRSVDSTRQSARCLTVSQR